MTNYETLLAQARSELAQLQNKKAVQDSQIENLVSQLNLDPSLPLEPQIEERIKALTEQRASIESEISQLLNELDSSNPQSGI